MPELRHITLGEIDEPPLPMRASMEDAELNDLAASLKEHGQKVPINVTQNGERYTIVYGHRRYVAAGLAGLPSLMALVYQPGEQDETDAMLTENLDRVDVNPAEEALFYAQLMERGCSTEEALCAKTKRKPDYIADRLRLLRDGEPVFGALMRKEINFSVARELNKCDDADMRAYYLRQAILAGTGARVVRQWIHDWRSRGAHSVQPQAVAETPQDAPQPDPTRIECILCGGHKDPWNLESVFIHKHELEKIQDAIARGAEA